MSKDIVRVGEYKVTQPTLTDGEKASLQTDNQGNAQIVGNVANGSAVSGKPVRIGGSDGTSVQNIKTDTNGNLILVGNIAHDGVDSGNPVKIGGKYNSTPPNVASGDRIDLQMTKYGEVLLGDPGIFLSDNIRAFALCLDAVAITTSGWPFHFKTGVNRVAYIKKITVSADTAGTKIEVWSNLTASANGTATGGAPKKYDGVSAPDVSTFKNPTVTAYDSLASAVYLPANGIHVFDFDGDWIVTTNRSFGIRAVIGTGNVIVSVEWTER